MQKSMIRFNTDEKEIIKGEIACGFCIFGALLFIILSWQNYEHPLYFVRMCGDISFPTISEFIDIIGFREFFSIGSLICLITGAVILFMSYFKIIEIKDDDEKAG